MSKVESLRILIKDHHDDKEDLVSRPLVRAYNNSDSEGFKNFIGEDGIYLYGYLKDGKVYEIFTNQILDIGNMKYEIIDSSVICEMVRSLSKEEIGKMYELINSFVFGNINSKNYDFVSEMENRALDRAKLFQEYNNDLSYVNPYEYGYLNYCDLGLVEQMRINNEVKKKIEKQRKSRH